MTEPNEAAARISPKLPFAVTLAGLAGITLLFYVVLIYLLQLPPLVAFISMSTFSSIALNVRRWKEYPPGQQIALSMTPITIMLALPWMLAWWKQGRVDTVPFMLTGLIWIVGLVIQWRSANRQL